MESQEKEMKMQPQPYLQPPQKRRARWPWVLLGVGLFAILLGCLGISLFLGAVGTEVDKQIEQGNTELRNHVKIDSCNTDQLGLVEITYTVYNTSDNNQSYWVQFAVNDSSGNRLSEAHGIVNNLAPGKVASRQNAIGGQVSGKFTCVVERVN